MEHCSLNTSLPSDTCTRTVFVSPLQDQTARSAWAPMADAASPRNHTRQHLPQQSPVGASIAESGNQATRKSNPAGQNARETGQYPNGGSNPLESNTRHRSRRARFSAHFTDDTLQPRMSSRIAATPPSPPLSIANSQPSSKK